MHRFMDILPVWSQATGTLPSDLTGLKLAAGAFYEEVRGWNGENGMGISCDSEGGTDGQMKKQGRNSRQCLCWKSEYKLVLEE